MTDTDDNDHHRPFLRHFTTHEPAVRAFIRRLVPSRADADDILQEVSIVLWEKFGEFRPEGDFRAWAFGIARFKVLSWLRDRGRDRLMLDSDVIELIAEESLRVDSHLERQRIALESCFERMPAKERDLLVRAYERNARIQEVALSSGRTVGGFYQWLHRMRKLLMDCVTRALTEQPS